MTSRRGLNLGSPLSVGPARRRARSLVPTSARRDAGGSLGGQGPGARAASQEARRERDQRARCRAALSSSRLPVLTRAWVCVRTSARGTGREEGTSPVGVTTRAVSQACRSPYRILTPRPFPSRPAGQVRPADRTDAPLSDTGRIGDRKQVVVVEARLIRHAHRRNPAAGMGEPARCVAASTSGGVTQPMVVVVGVTSTQITRGYTPGSAHEPGPHRRLRTPRAQQRWAVALPPGAEGPTRPPAAAGRDEYRSARGSRSAPGGLATPASRPTLASGRTTVGDSFHHTGRSDVAADRAPTDARASSEASVCNAET